MPYYNFCVVRRGSVARVMKNIVRILSLTGWVVLVFVRMGFGDSQNHPSFILQQLIEHSVKVHPSIDAAQAALEQVRARRGQILGYYDGSVEAGAGLSARRDGLPGGFGYPGLPRTGLGGYALLSQPLRSGLQVMAGIEQLWLDDLDTAPDSYYQTRGFAGVRFPLGRDRGFASQDLSEQSADQRFSASERALEEVRDRLRLAVVQAYLDLLESTAMLAVTREASERYEQVLVDMQERIRLQSAPAFQEHSARMERDLSIDSELAARHQLATARLNLQALLDAQTALPNVVRTTLVSWADELADQPVDQPMLVQKHPRIQQLDLLLLAAQTDFERAENELRPAIYLDGQVTWTGEDEDQPFGSNSYGDDHNEGYALMLTIQRSLSRTKECAARDQARARSEEIAALRETELRELERLRAVSEEQVRLARRQLTAAENAVAAAREALSAESERMQLGEGRNRDVLDARKDLTTSETRLIQAAANLLRGRAQWAYTADSQTLGLLPESF